MATQTDSTAQVRNVTRDQRRLFQCRACGRSFMKNEHLVRHIRSHTKDKPFACPDCGKAYSRQDILIRHRRHVNCKRTSVEQVTTADDDASATSTGLQQSPQGLTDNNETRILQPVSDGMHFSTSPIRNAPDLPSIAAQPDLTLSTFDNGPAITDHIDDVTTGQVPMLHLNTDTLNRDGNGDATLDLFYTDDQTAAWTIGTDLHDDFLNINFPADYGGIMPEVMPVSAADADDLQAKAVQNLWFDRISREEQVRSFLEREDHLPSALMTGDHSPTNESFEIDDKYRDRLRRGLEILSYEPTVPSVALLNTWIQLYFLKVHPTIPILHIPTFRPSKRNTSLLIAICAMGSLFTGSEQGLRQGIHLFQRIHKATLQNWEGLLVGRQDDMITTIQCAVIAQAFGLLSGDPRLLLTVDAFHGPPLAWARYSGLYGAHAFMLSDTSRTEEQWHKWVRYEESVRLTHALYIIDTEMASIIRREPSQSFEFYNFAFTSTDKAFKAANAHEWKEIYLVETSRNLEIPSKPLLVNLTGVSQIPDTSQLTAYAFMEGISSQILSSWNRGMDAYGQRLQCRQMLIEYHAKFLRHDTRAKQSPLQMSVLWHSVCMTASVNVELLERMIGRDGRKLSASDTTRVMDWANSERGLECVLHCLMIKKYIQEISVMQELAIHSPRALFWAGITLICYVRFGLEHEQSNVLKEPMHLINEYTSVVGDEWVVLLAEIRQRGRNGSFRIMIAISAIVDLLRRVGHWEIARKYAAILTAASSPLFDYGNRSV